MHKNTPFWYKKYKITHPLDLRCPFQMDWTPTLVKSQILACWLITEYDPLPYTRVVVWSFLDSHAVCCGVPRGVRGVRLQVAYQNASKYGVFNKKNTKIFRGWGMAPSQTHTPVGMGIPPPIPTPSAPAALWLPILESWVRHWECALIITLKRPVDLHENSCGYISDWNLSNHSILFARWRHFFQIVLPLSFQ